MNLFFIVVCAILLDHFLGEPQKYHPLVGFGRWVKRVENTLNPSRYGFQIQKMLGLIAWLILVVPLVSLSYFLQHFPVVELWLSPWILYFCIAPQSLTQHAEAVYIPLIKRDLNQARHKVSMIVSRDTQQMDAVAIRRATIESVLENGADAIFAPLFWFMLGGLPAVVLYRLSNTLDAMWGYKNSRYLYFGRVAARLDDILNWLPARLTAISYALIGHTPHAFLCWKQQAKFLESPNAGIVMTSGAGALNLKLGGSALYHGKLKLKPLFGCGLEPENKDILRANHLISQTLFLWLTLLFIGVYFA